MIFLARILLYCKEKKPEIAISGNGLLSKKFYGSMCSILTKPSTGFLLSVEIKIS